MGLTVLDAGVIIAILDASDAHHRAAIAAVRTRLDANDRLVVPASAYAESLVGPSRRGADAARVVDEFIDALPATVHPLDRRITARAAAIRASHDRPGRGRRRVRLPDALVLATAAELGAGLVLTTDGRWPPDVVRVEVVGTRG